MRRISIALLVLAVLAVACSGGDPEIAGVGETTIRLSEVQALYLEEQPVDDSFRQSLFSMMAIEAAAQALSAEYGLAVDPAVVAGYEEQLRNALIERAVSPAILFGIPNASEEMIGFQAGVWALKDTTLDALIVDPTVVDDLFADPATLTGVCTKHILVRTAEEAEEVKARLAAGEDFATVAGEVSIDTNAVGGDLGCNPAADFVSAFAQAALEAPIGEVYGPVQTSYGFHVLIVTQRTIPTREEYLLGPRVVLSDDQLTGIWAAWLERVVADADAWVAEEYGVWSPTGIQGPASQTTTTAGG